MVLVVVRGGNVIEDETVVVKAVVVVGRGNVEVVKSGNNIAGYDYMSSLNLNPLKEGRSF